MTRRVFEAPEFLGFRRLSRLLDETLGGYAGETEFNGAITSAWLPPTDVFEDKDALKILVELPGVKKEDVKLSLENQTLTIRGEKKQVAEEKTKRVHRYERTYGAFERSFALPNTVDPERVQAAFTDGLLTVTLPKVERARPREIPVTVK
jgi:HSP20 family protein